MKSLKLFLLLSIITTALSFAEDSKEQKAWKAIKDGALLVDVRSKQEVDAGMLKGAIHVPHFQVNANIEKFGKDKDRVIVVYCRVGGRAGQAKKTLEKLGFKNVINAGGYEMMKAAKE
jgi:phage shock protein E